MPNTEKYSVYLSGRRDTGDIGGMQISRLMEWFAESPLTLAIFTNPILHIYCMYSHYIQHIFSFIIIYIIKTYKNIRDF